jgi:cytochrome c oxidase subunit IV
MSASHTTRRHEPDEPHGVSQPPAHHHVPYLKVFFSLMVLTVITVAIGIYLRFPQEAINVLLALLVASIKGSLVAMYFMHLKFEGKLIYLIFVAPLVLCVILVVALLPDIIRFGDGSMTLFNTPDLYQAEHAAPAAAPH